MPQATRTFDTDLAELIYQISRSDAFERLQGDFRSGAIDDQEAQERLLELIDYGRCRLMGDRGPEEWSWKVTEFEAGRLVSALYREYLGAS